MKRWRRGALGLLAIAALAGAGTSLAPRLARSLAEVGTPEGAALRLGPQADIGSALRERRNHPSLLWYMPLGTLCADALARNPWALKPAFLALWLAPALCAWLLAEAMLRGCGALAAALALAAMAGGRYEDLETCLYTVVSSLAAWLLARSAEDPSAEAAGLGAAGAGASLLVRSPLFLLPAVWAASGGHRRLVALAYVPLMPWTLLNWRLSGRPWPFEAGRADQNIVGGALGRILTSNGDVAPGSPTGPELLLWAAGECLAHPLRTASAVSLRLGWAFLCRPWLWAAALFGFWRLRGRRGARALAAFSGYLLAAHCLMAVEERYFHPLIPILCAAAAAGMGSFLEAPGASRPAGHRRIALAAAAVLSAGILWADILVLRGLISPQL